MASSRSSSSSSAPPPLAPSRRQSRRAHSDSYHPIYSASSSASSDTSSIFSHASSSSSATSASTSRRAVSHKLARVRSIGPARAPSAPPSVVSVPFCTPEAGQTKVVLPRVLARPQPQIVSPAALVAASADLENVPLPYIIQSLKGIGPRMMAALARTTAPAPASLPRELEVHVVPDPEPDPGLDTLPTHLLAVYARSNADAAPAREGVEPRRKVTLFPTHAVMLAAHCAHLPPLPPGGKQTLNKPEDDSQLVQDDGQVPDLAQPIGIDKNHTTTVEKRHENEGQLVDSGHSVGHPMDAEKPEPVPETAVHGCQDAGDAGKPDPSPNTASHITLTLPVVPLCIPAPKMFPLLQTYLYTKRADHLLGTLIPSLHAPASIPTPTPTPPPPPPQSLFMSYRAPSPSLSDSDSTPRPSPAPSTPTPATPRPLPSLVPDATALSAQLAALHDMPTLVQAALRTHGVWADAAALGVFDERLWLTIDFAWRVLLGALERGAETGSDSDSGDEGMYQDRDESEDEKVDEEVGEEIPGGISRREGSTYPGEHARKR